MNHYNIECILRERPLKKHPYAQATIAETAHSVILFSYKTPVAEIFNGKAYCYGLFSATTRKHISAFACEYGLQYGVFKKVYEDEYLYYDISADVFVK